VSPLLQSQRQFATKSSLFQSIPDSNTSTGPPAFVFDIDGVLVRGKNVLSAARQAMQQVRHHTCSCQEAILATMLSLYHTTSPPAVQCFP
jgi:hypothetical protein